MGRLSGAGAVVRIAAFEIETAERGFLEQVAAEAAGEGWRGVAIVRKIDAGLDRVTAADVREVVDKLGRVLRGALEAAVVADGQVAGDVDGGQSAEGETAEQVGKELDRIECQVLSLPDAAMVEPG